ncbi:ABC transporter permease subunit [Mesorhizobium sp. DCY119]|uniref:ABC transporter permease n=1 Tax=Mesorhizobium sp. DCY119 TaxID=2108445 RepID=UPI000E6D079E|nr:ABC transporter permease subunit [Mesorhizobium sp. DCY119]RJG46109.1 ABC transporter permease subunit [Mesorhizobium sp. DCY119]
MAARRVPAWFPAIRNLIVLLAAWELAGRLHWIADGALPAPSAILMRMWRDRAEYPDHVLATLHASALGFLIGNAIAIAAGAVFAIFPTAGRIAKGINIAVFAIPPIALSPILVLTLSGMEPRVALAAIGCYFTTMTATVIGLTQSDNRAADVVRAYGGNQWAVLRLVQWRSALPTILSGLRVAAPNAVLGAILAEFGGGGRFGLGVYLLGSIGRGEPDRLWGIGLMATAIAGLAYWIFALIGRRLTNASEAVTISPGVGSRRTAGESAPRKLAIALASLLVPFALWWALLILLGVPGMIAKTPLGLFDYLFISPGASIAQAKLWSAVWQTLPMTVAGMAAGLAFAFLLALSAQIYPGLVRAFLPVALISQSMPLVALTPLLVLIFGRGVSLILWVTVSVTFFPAFVTMAQGLLQVPQAALDLPRAYGASRLAQLRWVSIPASLPYLFAAARLTAPRALLGVMIAEWLATGTGLGNLINQSRGYLDYGMVWAVALVSVLLSVVFYQAVAAIERTVLRRRGMTTVE